MAACYLESRICEANSYMLKNQWETALQLWETIRREFPSSSLGFVRAGCVYRELGEFSKAESFLREAKERFPNDAMAHIHYAELYMWQKSWETALELWEEIRLRFPSFSSGFVRAGCVYRELGEFSKAESFLREAKERFPNDAMAHIHYAELAMTCCNWAEAARRWDEFSFSGTDALYCISRKIHALVNSCSENDSQRILNIFSTFNTENFTITHHGCMELGRIILITNNECYLHSVLSFLMTKHNAEDAHSVHPILTPLKQIFQTNTNKYNTITTIINEIISSDDYCLDLDVNTTLLLISFISDTCDFKYKSAITHCLNNLPVEYNKYWLHNMNSKQKILMRTILKKDIETPSKDSDSVYLGKVLAYSVFDAENHIKNIKKTMSLRDCSEKLIKSLSLIVKNHETQSNISGTIQTNDNPKIALCVSGQMRGYAKTFNSWNLFGFKDLDVDIFVHTWRNIGRKFPLPINDNIGHLNRTFSKNFLETYKRVFGIHINALEFMKEKYPNLFYLLMQSETISEKQLMSFYNTEHVVVEDETDIKFRSFNQNTHKMYYKVNECFKMTENTNTKYDIVIRIRPDLFIHKCETPLAQLIPAITCNNIYVDNFGLAFNWDIGYCLADQVAIGNLETMRAYSFSYEMTKKANKAKHLYGYPSGFIPHLNFAYSMLFSNIMPERIPGFTSSLIDTDVLTAR